MVLTFDVYTKKASEELLGFIHSLIQIIMVTLVFKTNIDTEQKFNYVRYLFRNIPQIKRWSVDQEDEDKILKIEVAEGFVGANVNEWLNRINIYSEELN